MSVGASRDLLIFMFLVSHSSDERQRGEHWQKIHISTGHRGRFNQVTTYPPFLPSRCHYRELDPWLRDRQPSVSGNTRNQLGLSIGRPRRHLWIREVSSFGKPGFVILQKSRHYTHSILCLPSLQSRNRRRFLLLCTFDKIRNFKLPNVVIVSCKDVMLHTR